MDSHQFHNKELRLDKDLHNGKAIHAAVSLLNEFDTKPQEALALIRREMNKPQVAGKEDKLHIGIQANGEVFVWDKDERNGIYAGKIPANLRDCPSAKAPVEASPVVAAPTEVPVAKAEAPLPPVVESKPAELPPVVEAKPEQVASGPQTYEYQQPHHRGFHIPMPIDIGVRDGSLHLGVNILGLVKGGVSLGEKNRGYVGSDALKTEVSAGVDLNKNHIGPAGDWNVLDGALTKGSARVGITPGQERINIGAGADASAFGESVGAGGHGGVELGQRLGPHADAYAHVGDAKAAVDGYANLSDQGLQAGATGDVGAQPYAGVHAGGKFGLGAKNEAHADVGTNIGDNGLSAGAGIYPQFHPDVYVQGYAGEKEAGVGLIPARAWSRNADAPENTPEK